MIVRTSQRRRPCARHWNSREIRQRRPRRASRRPRRRRYRCRQYRLQHRPTLRLRLRCHWFRRRVHHRLSPRRWPPPRRVLVFRSPVIVLATFDGVLFDEFVERIPNRRWLESSALGNVLTGAPTVLPEMHVDAGPRLCVQQPREDVDYTLVEPGSGPVDQLLETIADAVPLVPSIVLDVVTVVRHVLSIRTEWSRPEKVCGEGVPSKLSTIW